MPLGSDWQMSTVSNIIGFIKLLMQVFATFSQSATIADTE